MAINRQMYQFDPNPDIQLTDIVPWSNESHSHAASYSYFSDFLNKIIIPVSQVTNLVGDLASKLNLSGGTMTGFLTLNADPASDLQASTKHYVDGMTAAVNLNTAYAATIDQNFNIPNGLNINGNSLNVTGNDGSTVGFTGNYLEFFSVVNGGAGNSSAQLQWVGSNDQQFGQLYSNLYLGFSYDALLNHESGFFIWEILSDGQRNKAFSIRGAEPSYPSTRVIFGGDNAIDFPDLTVDIGVGYYDAPEPSAVFQVASTTKGALLPVMTLTQRNAIVSPIVGLELNNSTWGTKDYFAGSSWATTLTNVNLHAGTNITIVPNGDGTFTLNTTGGTASSKIASDNSKTYVASVFSAVGLGNFAKFADTFGTVRDGGAFLTDTIPQGSSNQWLSTDGGATFQNTTGPLTVNNVAVFSTVGGQLKDGGVINTSAAKFASDNTKSTVASVWGPTTIGNLLVAADASGTVQNSAIPASSVMLSGGAAGGELAGTYPNPTILGHAVSNAKFRQSAALSLVGNSTNSTADVADIVAALDGQILRRSGAVIGFGAIDLASSNAVNGLLAFANGGLGFATATAGDLFYASATNTPGKLPDVATGQVLVSGGVGVAPAYSANPVVSSIGVGVTPTNPVHVQKDDATSSPQQITLQGTTNPAKQLLIGYNTTSNFGSIQAQITGTSQSPLYLNPLGGAVRISTGNLEVTNNINNTALTASLGVFTDSGKNLTSAGTLGFSQGGFGFSTCTLGDIFFASASNTPGKLAAVAANQVITSNGVGAAPVYSSTPIVSQITLTNTGGPAVSIANTGTINAKNSSGTSEVLFIPRWSDNKTYMDIGSSGAIFRQNAAGTTWMTVDTSGNVNFSQGNLALGTAGKTFSLKTGANACIGFVALSGASTTVLTSAITTGDHIHLGVSTPGGTQGGLSYSINSGVSFVITSTLGVLDTSTVVWDILKAA